MAGGDDCEGRATSGKRGAVRDTNTAATGWLVEQLGGGDGQQGSQSPPRRYGMTGSLSYSRRARARDKVAEAAYDSRVDT